MAIPKLQNPFDWITQLGHMLLGRKVNAADDEWLVGPVGGIDEKAEKFAARIAEEHGLEIRTNEPGAGLIDSFEELGYSINPRIEAFYNRTSDFQLDTWTEWKPFFKPFGFLIGIIFSKRIQQLYLPMNSLETAQGIVSEIIQLVDSKDNAIYRIWHRRLKKSENVIFYGIYTHCRLPSGKPGIKTIFPLPQGSATAIFEIQKDSEGNLELISSGKTYGDPGFYVMIEDRRGRLYKHYMSYFRQRINVYEDDEGTIRADHTMNLWSFRVHNMHYKIVEKQH
jgi:hypothetical protein